MKNPVRDFVIGATAIIGVVGLCVLLWLVGELSWLRTPTYALSLRMDNAGGVLPAAPITLNGVRIGNVKAVRTSDDPRTGVVLTLAIEQTVRVPRDVSVAILRDLVGAATLSLTALPSDATGPGAFFTAGDSFQSKAYAPGLTGELSSLLDKRLGTLDTAVAKFNALADTYTDVGKRLGAMLEPRKLADVQDGKVEGNLTTTMERFDLAVADARSWLSDPEMKGDAKGAVKKLSDTLDRVAALADEWKQTAEVVNQRVGTAGESFDKAVTAFAEATRTMSETLHEMQGLVGKAAAGEGTVGQLLTNPDLFRNLNDAAVRLEQTLTEAKLMIEKYRKEGVPIQF